MFYKSELSFLCEVFERNRIYAKLLSKEETERYFNSGEGSASLLEAGISFSASELCEGTLYKLEDKFCCHYRILLLPESEGKILVVGPFLKEEIGQRERLEIAEKRGLSPKKERYLSEYYRSIPILNDDSHLLVMLNVFCEKIWKTPSFAISEINGEQITPESHFGKPIGEENTSDTLINMKAMERRYEFENEIIRAVELGLSKIELPLSLGESGEFFERRVADPIRNSKNYGIIMNTLLRKAAERGGVHPIYLDSISSDFAMRLERAEKVGEISLIMQEMFRSYCRLVRKHRLKGYSLTVQKIILSIDADLSENLTSSSLAKKHGISLGYLSSVFKRETGKTVSEYISQRRIEYAKYLLSSTGLQVQTVALHAGIMDVQYFSKLFKRLVGKTPTEYRISLKNENKNLQK